MVPLMNPATKARASATRAKGFPPHMIVTSAAVTRTFAAVDYTGKSCRVGPWVSWEATPRCAALW